VKGKALIIVVAKQGKAGEIDYIKFKSGANSD
jgi:hypothetical protein